VTAWCSHLRRTLRSGNLRVPSLSTAPCPSATEGVAGNATGDGQVVDHARERRKGDWDRLGAVDHAQGGCGDAPTPALNDDNGSASTRRAVSPSGGG